MRGVREVKRGVRGEEGASALRRPFRCPSRGLSGTFLVLVQYLSRAVYQPFRAGKDGDDLQRVNRVVHAWGTHCHFVVQAQPRRIKLKKNPKM